MTIPVRASLMAEMVRFGLRRFMKSRAGRQNAYQSRAKLHALERWVPPPPRGIETAAVDVAGVVAERVLTPLTRRDYSVLYLHGGGYRAGALPLFRHFTWRIANAARGQVLAIAYRLAPEYPFPAALEDAETSYRWLLANGIDSHHITLLGDSAGGGLTFSLLLKLRDEGLPLPAAAVGLSPWTDLALTGATLKTNASADPMLNVRDLPGFAADYLGGVDPRNPYASPIYGNLRDLPPALIQVGSDEILRDDAVRLAEGIQAAGGQAELQIWPRMPHGWQMFAPILPDARAAIEEIARFLRQIGAGAIAANDTSTRS